MMQKLLLYLFAKGAPYVNIIIQIYYFTLSKSVPPVATLTGNYKHTLQDNTVREEQSFFCLCSEYKEKSKIKPQISFSIFFDD